MSLIQTSSVRSLLKLGVCILRSKKLNIVFVFWDIIGLKQQHISLFFSRYEKRYLEDAKLKAAEQAKAEKMMQAPDAETQNPTVVEKNMKSSTSNLSAQQDLDTFLLGDLEDSDGGPGTFF